MGGLSILAVLAHPADMATEIGGTLALHAQRGDKIKVMIMTHGARIHPNIYIEEARKKNEEKDDTIAGAGKEKVIAIKHAECESCADILGIENIIYLDREDTQITVNEEMVAEVVTAIEDFEPEILITHHPGYGAPSGDAHGVAGQIAISGASAAARQLSNMGEKDPVHIKQIYMISNGISGKTVLYPGGGFTNDVYVDITSVVEKKIRSMDQFVSQGYEGEYARKCVASHNGHWGSLAGVAFAEPFMRFKPETHQYLPLPEIMAKRDIITLHRKYSTNTNLWQIPTHPSPTSELIK